MMGPVPAPDDGDERTRAVRGMFSAIAPTYDLLNRLLSFGADVRWRRALVSCLPREGSRVLDLACGTGDVTLEAASARPGVRLFGADFSLPMLRRAREKTAGRGVSDRVSLQNASAEDLPYGPGVFDAVTVAFGIRNVVRRERAVAELFRVLKPGGSALLLDFSLPSNPIVRFGYGLYFHRILPLLGGLVSRNFAAYRYLPKSVAGFPPRQEFKRMLEGQGFTDVRWEDFTFGVVTLYRGVRPEAFAACAVAGSESPG